MNRRVPKQNPREPTCAGSFFGPLNSLPFVICKLRLNHQRLPDQIGEFKMHQTLAFACTALLGATAFSAQANAVCVAQGNEVLLSKLPATATRTALGLEPAAAKTGDEGKYRLRQVDGDALVVTTDGAGYCEVMRKPKANDSSNAEAPRLAGTAKASDVAPAPATQDPVTKILAEKLDKALPPATVTQLISEGQAQTGVPGSPAASLLDIEPARVGSPRTPKELSAALLNGRGADGKLKSGVALDFSLTQLIGAFEFLQPKKPGDAATTNPLSAKTLRERDHLIGLVPNERYFRAISKLFSEDLDNTHRALNRIKLSFATTENQADSTTGTPTKPVNAQDMSFGLVYVPYDAGDPLTTDCDGENSMKPNVQEALAIVRSDASVAAKKRLTTLANSSAGSTTESGPLDGKRIQTLRQSILESMHNIAKDIGALGVGAKKGSLMALEAKYNDERKKLGIVEAACSLTTIERFKAPAFHLGAAVAYKVTDGA